MTVVTTGCYDVVGDGLGQRCYWAVGCWWDGDDNGVIVTGEALAVRTDIDWPALRGLEPGQRCPLAAPDSNDDSDGDGGVNP